jgi:hypothetical protein
MTPDDFVAGASLPSGRVDGHSAGQHAAPDGVEAIEMSNASDRRQQFNRSSTLEPQCLRPDLSGTSPLLRA